MATRFRKSFQIMKGVRINLSKSGPSLSIGSGPLTLNFNKKGIRKTASIPGTGLSFVSQTNYDDLHGASPKIEETNQANKNPSLLLRMVLFLFKGLGVLIGLFVIYVIGFVLFSGSKPNVVSIDRPAKAIAPPPLPTPEQLRQKVMSAPAPVLSYPDQTHVKTFPVDQDGMRHG